MPALCQQSADILKSENFWARRHRAGTEPAQSRHCDGKEPSGSQPSQTAVWRHCAGTEPSGTLKICADYEAAQRRHRAGNEKILKI